MEYADLYERKIREQHEKLCKRLDAAAFEYLCRELNGIPHPEKDPRDFKYAFVIIKGNQHMVMIDKNSDNQQAYYLQDDCPRRTENKVDKYSFVRWCTGFDL